MNPLLLHLLLATSLVGGDPIQCAPDAFPELRDDRRWDPCDDSVLVYYTFGVSDKDPRSPLETPVEIGYVELRDSMIWHRIPSTFVPRPDGISAWIILSEPLTVREANGQLRSYAMWPRCSYFDADRTDDLNSRYDFVAQWQTPVIVEARRTSDSSLISSLCAFATNDLGDNMYRTDEDFQLVSPLQCSGLPFARWTCSKSDLPLQPRVSQQTVSYRCWTADTTVFTAWYGTVSDVASEEMQTLTHADIEYVWITDQTGRTVPATVDDAVTGIRVVRPQQLQAGLYGVTFQTRTGTMIRRIELLE